jgi:hypothetical protein
MVMDLGLNGTVGTDAGVDKGVNVTGDALCGDCHTNPLGFSPVNGFGAFLEGYGLDSNTSLSDQGSTTSVTSALTSLERQDPAVYAEVRKDIQEGVNPNSDPKISAAANSVALPQPEFGCGQLAPGRAPARQLWCVAGLVGAVVLWRRRAKRARRDAPPLLSS